MAVARIQYEQALGSWKSGIERSCLHALSHVGNQPPNLARLTTERFAHVNVGRIFSANERNIRPSRAPYRLDEACAQFDRLSRSPGAKIVNNISKNRTAAHDQIEDQGREDLQHLRPGHAPE
jgi:hypothetical protein